MPDQPLDLVEVVSGWPKATSVTVRGLLHRWGTRSGRLR
jgi:hypothetical protein